MPLVLFLNDIFKLYPIYYRMKITRQTCLNGSIRKMEINTWPRFNWMKEKWSRSVPANGHHPQRYLLKTCWDNFRFTVGVCSRKTWSTCFMSVS